MKTAARRLALLAGVLEVLATLGVLVLGLWPVPPDGPPPGVVSNMPGDGPRLDCCRSVREILSG
jgi:hypothetical protein